MLIQLILFLRKFDFDIIQTILSTANFWGRIAAIISGKKILIASERNVEDWKSTIRLVFDHVLANFTDLILVNSLRIQKFLLETTKVDPSKIILVYNGVDSEKYKSDNSLEKTHSVDFFSQYGIKKNKIIIGTIGRLAAQKDYPTFLQACRMIIEEYNDISIIIVGEGPLFSELQIMVSKLALEKNVFFLGRQKEVSEIMNLFDVFVLTSIREGFANVILEAMAASKPVVATDVGGNSEAVIDGVTGIIVQAGSPKSVAMAVLHLINNKQISKTMGHNGNKRIVEEFSLGNMVNNTTAVYMKLLSEYKVK